MNRNGKLHALLSTARVANVPSVVSNVWVGLIIGAITAGTSSSISTSMIFGLPLAGVLLYLSGNFFNDWMDRKWDMTHRPERALPRKLFSSRLYSIFALAFGSSGVALAASTSPLSGGVAAGIALSIVIYTVFHKRTAWAVIPMGLCRALLPIMGSIAIFPYVDYIWPAAAALFCYIMGLSLSARYESMAEPPRWIGYTSRGLLLGAAVLVTIGNRHLLITVYPTLAGVFPYLLWTSLCLRIWRKPIPVLVSRLLAGIPLVDWMTLLPLSLMLSFYGASEVIPMVIAGFAVPPLAFISALLLQRLAPAT